MQTLAQLALAIDQDAVPKALEWLDATGRQAGWPPRTLFKLRLCLDETLTNITLYSHAGAPPDGDPPLVELVIRQHEETLILEICDNGVPFDPTAQTPRDLDTSLDDARIGGHGLRLMHHYLDDLTYERRDGWNCLSLVARLDSSP
jgi:Anti-sigma regulatory factor (Ser/Thr protein kinase)